jgi:hypothetical protein
MENKTQKTHKRTERFLGYSLPKLTEEERTWKHWMSGGVFTNVKTGEITNYNELKKTIPSYFQSKYEMYCEYVLIFNRFYDK